MASGRGPGAEPGEVPIRASVTGTTGGNIRDLASLRRGAAEADGAIHTAFLHVPIIGMTPAEAAKQFG